MEMIDILNPDGTFTGITKERTAVHEDGDLHATVHTFVIRKKEEGYEVLLQKRSACKDSFPGCFDLSSAGHIGAGQSKEEAVIRELYEELGVSRSINDFLYVYHHEGYSERIFYGKPFKNHEISYVYVLMEDLDVKTLTLQALEVESVSWILLSDLKLALENKDPHYCIFLDEVEAVIRFLERREHDKN